MKILCVEKQPEANSLVEQELIVDETSGAVVHYSHLVELLTHTETHSW